eukprot:TRINITY_DN1031_c0_g1_i13.p3 TRINITY_DN1031_c0_g1~~TRINITY_DN1031_c0_g1_i13.p3  ORF type:complete len:495 (+),score=117.75 TRINITY_DN1031_c0_g1_i13:2987-4471(+)
MGWGIFDKISDTVKDVGDFGGKTITTGVEFGGKAIDAATKEIKNVVEKGSAIVDWAASVPGLDVVLQKIKESEIPGTDITVAEGLAIADRCISDYIEDSGDGIYEPIRINMRVPDIFNPLIGRYVNRDMAAVLMNQFIIQVTLNQKRAQIFRGDIPALQTYKIENFKYCVKIHEKMGVDTSDWGHQPLAFSINVMDYQSCSDGPRTTDRFAILPNAFSIIACSKTLCSDDDDDYRLYSEKNPMSALNSTLCCADRFQFTKTGHTNIPAAPMIEGDTSCASEVNGRLWSMTCENMGGHFAVPVEKFNQRSVTNKIDTFANSFTHRHFKNCSKPATTKDATAGHLVPISVPIPASGRFPDIEKDDWVHIEGIDDGVDGWRKVRGTQLTLADNALVIYVKCNDDVPLAAIDAAPTTIVNVYKGNSFRLMIELNDMGMKTEQFNAFENDGNATVRFVNQARDMHNNYTVMRKRLVKSKVSLQGTATYEATDLELPARD